MERPSAIRNQPPRTFWSLVSRSPSTIRLCCFNLGIIVYPIARTLWMMTVSKGLSQKIRILFTNGYTVLLGHLLVSTRAQKYHLLLDLSLVMWNPEPSFCPKSTFLHLKKPDLTLPATKPTTSQDPLDFAATSSPRDRSTCGTAWTLRDLHWREDDRRGRLIRSGERPGPVGPGDPPTPVGPGTGSALQEIGWAPNRSGVSSRPRLRGLLVKAPQPLERLIPGEPVDARNNQSPRLPGLPDFKDTPVGRAGNP